jgi:hypothetical protein
LRTQQLFAKPGVTTNAPLLLLLLLLPRRQAASVGRDRGAFQCGGCDVPQRHGCIPAGAAVQASSVRLQDTGGKGGWPANP